MVLKHISTTILFSLLSFTGMWANSEFILGNEAYQENQYAKAIEHYQTSLETFHSSEQHFNLANAYYQEEKYGHAILHYLKAEALAPSNPEIQANLTIARKAAKTSMSQANFLQTFSTLLNVNAWTWVLAIAFWTSFALILLPRVFRFKSITSNLLLTLGITTALISLMALTYYYSQKGNGVVLFSETPIRVAPTESSPTIAFLNQGTLGKTKKNHQKFFFVKTLDNKEGWIKKSEFQKIWDL